MVSAADGNADCDIDSLHGPRKHRRTRPGRLMDNHFWIRTGSRLRILMFVLAGRRSRLPGPRGLPCCRSTSASSSASCPSCRASPSAGVPVPARRRRDESAPLSFLLRSRIPLGIGCRKAIPPLAPRVSIRVAFCSLRHSCYGAVRWLMAIVLLAGLLWLIRTYLMPPSPGERAETTEVETSSFSG